MVDVNKLIYLACAIFLIWFGISNLKMGIRAFREGERAIGRYNPKSGLVSGPLLIIAGLVILIVGVCRGASDG
jgi:uncharacterized membrane protein YidH (DUF202 family)